MIRVKLTQLQATSYFSKILKLVDKKTLCFELQISERTLRDWIRLKHRPPLHSLHQIENMYKIDLPPDIVKQDTIHEKSTHGRKGALERYRKHGHLGTVEGRIKGGMNSVKVHSLTHSRFQTTVRCAMPKANSKLAEFIGIVIGDGNISHGQIGIYLNSVDDFEYIQYVLRLIETLYSYKASISIHKIKKLATIRISSTHIVRNLELHGLIPGNKIKNQLIFTNWISNDLIHATDALRGLFDTDGSVYLDVHKTKTKSYSYVNIAFSIYNRSLYQQVVDLLLFLGFHPTTSTPHNVLIRIADEVYLFFSIIQPANKKHLDRYRYFVRRSN